jgi:hypothetical protein
VKHDDVHSQIGLDTDSFQQQSSETTDYELKDADDDDGFGDFDEFEEGEEGDDDFGDFDDGFQQGEEQDDASFDKPPDQHPVPAPSTGPVSSIILAQTLTLRLEISRSSDALLTLGRPTACPRFRQLDRV